MGSISGLPDIARSFIGPPCRVDKFFISHNYYIFTVLSNMRTMMSFRYGNETGAGLSASY
jgi:hypothetical protein